MFKVEDIQNYGKEQLEQVVNSASGVQSGLHAIATAYGDYTRKSFELTKSFVEQLAGVRSLDQAIEIQTAFVKQAYEAYMTEAQKICELYNGLARQTYEGAVPKEPAAR